MPIYAAALRSSTSSYSSVANSLRDFLHSQDSSSPAAWAFVGSDVKAVCLRHFYQVRRRPCERRCRRREGNIRSGRSFRSSKIKTTRANWFKRNVIWLHRKRIIVHWPIPFGDRDDKLVILHDERHDVPH